MIISYKLGDDLSSVQLILCLIEVMFIFVFVVFAQIIIHEAGHLIAGLMRGYRFLSFMILNFMITRKDGKFHFSRFGIPGAGGQCLMVPPAEGDTDAGIAFYNAGGVIINAVVGIVSGLILAFFYDSMSFEAISFVWAFTIIGVIFAIQNGVPMSMGGLPNDGKNIKELKKDRFSTQVFLNSMRILASLQQGEDIDSVMPEYMCDDRELNLENSIHAMALNFDLCAAVSRKDFGKACVIIDRALEASDKMVDIYVREFRMEQVFMAVAYPAYGHDAGRLMDDDLRAYMNKQALVRPDVLRMQYAYVRLYEHDEEKADAIYERFVKMCKTFYNLSEVRYETELVDMLRKMPLQ